MFLNSLKCFSRSCALNFNKHFANYSTNGHTVCVVGSGPAGFGITQYIMKNNKSISVDMIEKAPVPYGLIRYGVSPDHQDVKNCINSYEKLAENPKFSFYGNLEVGSEILPLEKLLSVYDAVVLCTGAQEPRKLNVSGENLLNVFTSNEFVGWYNGEPQYNQLKPDLSGTTAVVVGVGNVALDCARMLLKPINELEDTDMAEKAVNALRSSNINEVILVGRRGLLQMACTRKEMSEIIEIPNVGVRLNDCIDKDISKALKIKDLKKRKQQRLVKYLLKMVEKKKENYDKMFDIKLLRTPKEIMKSGARLEMTLEENRLFGEDPFSAKAEGLAKHESVFADLVITSLGYDNMPISSEMPFGDGRVDEVNGKVRGIPRLYVCGWCRMGAKGVLADTLNDSMVTGQTVLNDLNEKSQHKERKSLTSIISNTRVTNWSDWKKMDAIEIKNGLKNKKIREKIIQFDQYLS